jgi:hypothetical protein
MYFHYSQAGEQFLDMLADFYFHQVFPELTWFHYILKISLGISLLSLRDAVTLAESVSRRSNIVIL